MTKLNIGAIVVTYNRKTLLEECLDALLGQNHPLKTILVIDNASTDGTDLLFTQGKYQNESQIDYRPMPTNLGGAGGFHEGFKLASEDTDLDWVWIMDDDTIPYPDSLDHLIEALDSTPNNTSFLASTVYGPEEEPMNVPIIQSRPSGNGYTGWYRQLKKGLVEIEAATFVSLLIRNTAIREVGLPLKDYFIWGDDFEFTYRLTTHYGPAYFVGGSEVLHKRFNAKGISILDEENETRLGIYHYFYRNNLINTSEYKSTKELIRMIGAFQLEAIRVVTKSKIKYRWKKFKAIQTGIAEFIFRRYDREAFDNRMKGG